MNILLFGGSFDPPHVGHQRLLAAALRALRPDRTYLIPAWQSPLKTRHQATPADRRRMTELVAASVSGRRRRIRVDPFELKRAKTTYTYQLLRHFRSKYPDAELWFLAGSDTLATFGRWKRPNELKTACRWIVGLRPGWSGRVRGLRARQLPGLFPDISSTEVRCLFLAGLDAARWLPAPVLTHVRKKKLYGANLHQELRRTLPPERYRHTLGVARLALELARTHAFDPEAAALAGLLHDCGRRFDLMDMVSYARRRKLPVPALAQIARHAPILAHAYVSADLARDRFGVNDSQVLSAIRNHTLGEPGMSNFDRLLYVADVASEDRGFPEAARVRKIARRNLDRAFVEAVRTKIEYVSRTGQWLHPRTSALSRWARRLA